jgi:hypothetical protein
MASNSQIAFAPLGDTQYLEADVTPPNAVQAPINPKFNAKNPGQYRVINDSDETVFLGYGHDATTAETNAADASSGSTKAIVLVPGAIEVLRFNESTFFSAYAADVADVYITPGQGL